MSIFALMVLGNDNVQLHINLCVFGSYVREKGESVRTRKGWWDNKLRTAECLFGFFLLLERVDMVLKTFFFSWKYCTCVWLRLGGI